MAAALLVLIASTWLPIAHASLRHAARKSQQTLVRFGSALPFLADLDGDKAADRVKLSSNGFAKTVDIKFANLRTSEFSFAANTCDEGTLVAKDIDGDGDIDLIWLANRYKQNAVVLINDGKGDFTRAEDNAPYAAALDRLVSSSDPTDQDSVQAGKQTLSLTSSSSPDIAASASSWLRCPTFQSVSFAGAEGFTNRSAFLSYIHKRGPPRILS